MKGRNSGQISLYLLTLAIALYFPLMFSGAFRGAVDFWSLFAGGLMFFLICASAVDRFFSQLIYFDFREKTLRALALGAVSAFLLYGLFFVGNFFLWKIFPASAEHLPSIYSLKNGSSQLRIGLFLGLIIGPGEELLWRGWLQRRWAGILGRTGGWLAVSLLYALVHLPGGNPVLALAALVCGLWWGFQYYRFNSLLANVISHTLWDLMVFIFFPFA